MKFQEAFDKACDVMQEKQKGKGTFGVTPETAKTLAFLWTMLAISQNVLDDMAYIDNNNAIISVPLKKETGAKNKKANKSVNDDKPDAGSLTNNEQKE